MVVLPRFLLEASLGLSWLDMMTDESKTGGVGLLFECVCVVFCDKRSRLILERKDSKCCEDDDDISLRG